MKNFNPNKTFTKKSGIFGLPYSSDQAKIVLLPIPWDVTASHKAGTAKALDSILEASLQMDLYHPDFPQVWQQGIAMVEISKDLKNKNQKFRNKAEKIISALEAGDSIEDHTYLKEELEAVNSASKELNLWVKKETENLLSKNKLVGLIGGDHSVPLGYLETLAERYDDFGILQFDAHMDLRESYQGFEYSHASIMHNVLKLESIKKLIMVGVREYCENEVNVVENAKGRIKAFTDFELKKSLFAGKSWQDICNEIIDVLPNNVYISFDIDGLQPSLCPNTGTPVPGGLQMEEVIFLISQLVKSEKNIIGFDLVEVGQDDFDVNIATRIIYQLCGYMEKST